MLVCVRMCVYVYVNMWMCVRSCACVCEHGCKCRGQKSASGIFLLLSSWDTVSHRSKAHWLHGTGWPGRPKEPPLSVSPPRGSDPLLCAQLLTQVWGIELRMLCLYRKHVTDRAIPSAHKDDFWKYGSPWINLKALALRKTLEKKIEICSLS